ncbi:MAG: PTS transporter subunit EIIC [Lachnospiraceae bacterium]|nr:PTS transporter subunit EIIC [Lachnospiraceae bacterium]
MANSNEQIAKEVLKAVGGKENITNVAHCMTRLRFNLKDMGIPSEEKIKAIKGVLGVTVAGGQFQVIIGQNVPKVYDSLCEQGGIAKQEVINENLDAPKEKLTPKKIGSNIMAYLSGSMVALIPVMMAAGLFKAVLSVIGPDMLGLISAESNLYILLDFLYDAGFYFIPILLGFSAAKKLGIDQMLGAYMGCILIAPDLLTLVSEGASFSILGIPVTLSDYSQTVMPILLSVWIMSYIYKFFKKVMPDALTTIFTPFLTMAVITPISLCLLAPLGTILSGLLSGALLALGNATGFIGVGIIAALWEFVVMTGMHMVILMAMFTTYFETGYMTGISLVWMSATWAAFGMALGAALRLKNKEDKSMSFGCFISGIIGGITEPVLYGLGFKYKRTFLGLMIGAFVGGCYAGITNVCAYVMVTSSNFLSLIAYTGGSSANMINGVITCILSFVVATVATYFLGFSKEELAAQ